MDDRPSEESDTMTAPPEEESDTPMIPTATADLADDLAAILLLCSTLYGNTEGKAHIAIGIDPHLNAAGKYDHQEWVETNFEWPAEAEQLAREVRREALTEDVYLCPYLMRSDKRAKGTAIERRIVHCDYDGTINPDKIRELPGAFAVASGTPGHAQVYVPLTEPVNATQHQILCKALGAHLGPDADNKISDNDLMRPTGTWNHKPTVTGGEPAPVGWLIRPDGQRIQPDTLAKLLKVNIGPSQPPGATNGHTLNGTPAAAGEPFLLADYPKVVEALHNPKLKTDGTIDRSETIYSVLYACVTSNLICANARWIVAETPVLATKLAEQGSRDDIGAAWLKITDSRQEARRNQGGGTADTFFGPNTDDGGNTTTTNSHTTDNRPKLWRASALKQAQQPKFLAKNRIPQAAITILIGEEGIGKSLLWVYLAAAITTGTPRPEFGIPATEPADLLIIITEDEWSSVVLPRLTVAGADLDRIHVICTEDDGSGSPVFPDDMHIILNADITPAMVVCDAWLDTVPGKIRVGDAQQSRQVLHPWKEMSNKTGAAALLVTHANRLESGNIRDKYGATASLRQKARMTLYCLADKTGTTLIVGPDKSNGTSARTKASQFRITAVPHFQPTADHDGTVPKLVFAGDSDKTIKELLAAQIEQERTKGKPPSAAELWLREFLTKHGAQKATDIYLEGEMLGFSKYQLKRAKANINKSGTASVHVYQPPGTPNGPWYWELQQTDDGE